MPFNRDTGGLKLDNKMLIVPCVGIEPTRTPWRTFLVIRAVWGWLELNTAL